MIPEKAGNPETEEKPPEDTRPRHARKWNARTCFYGSLLFFIVAAVVLLLAVPALRSRLVQRSRDLYGAVWGTRAPVMANVSDRQADYPEEFEREPSVFPDVGQAVPEDWIFRIPSGGAAEKPESASSLISPPVEDLSAGKAAVKEASAAGPGTEEPNSGIEYSTGKAETDAYTLLLEKFPKVAALVRGSDPSLQFLSWGGAEVQEGVYWVRLIFEAGGDRDVYVWQVNLQSGEVQPLSYNARTVS